MLLTSAGAVRYFAFESFDPKRVAHAVFTRHGGVSPEPYASLNMSGSTGDSPHNVLENRTRAFRALGRDPRSVADLWQLHSADVIVAEAPNGVENSKGRADILLTDHSDVTLFLRFADCVPILLYDPRRLAVGLVHAGWRGTLKNAAAAGVRAMQTRYQSRPCDILAGIGPSIGPCHYAVGSEVVDAARRFFANSIEEVLHAVNGGFHLDLWAANALTLRQAGVEHIEVSGMCTACQTYDFFSHRAAQGATGRFGAVIGLR